MRAVILIVDDDPATLAEDRVLEEEARILNSPFLLKPIDPPQLLQLIDDLLAKRQR
jgi:CheY-like chemotaxis protein